MEIILHKLELKWWDTHIHFVDENKSIQTIFPSLRKLWFQRKGLINTLAWATLGLPLGILLGTLKSLTH